MNTSFSLSSSSTSSSVNSSIASTPKLKRYKNLKVIPITIYPGLHQNSNFDSTKAPGLNDLKSPHILNIGRLKIVQPRELSRGPNSNVDAGRGITKTNSEPTTSADSKTDEKMQTLTKTTTFTDLSPSLQQKRNQTTD